MKHIGNVSSGWAFIAGVMLVSIASPAGANEIDELKAQIKALQDRLSKIEAEQKKAADKAVTAGDKAGSLKLPGSDTSISIGGYVKSDVYLDNRNDRATRSIPQPSGSTMSRKRRTTTAISAYMPSSRGFVSIPTRRPPWGR